MKLASTFAILDVKLGRKRLRKLFEGNDRPHPVRIPVVIHGWVDGTWSRDDGTSQEFGVNVEKVFSGPAQAWDDKRKAWVEV